MWSSPFAYFFKKEKMTYDMLRTSASSLLCQYWVYKLFDSSHLPVFLCVLLKRLRFLSASAILVTALSWSSRCNFLSYSRVKMCVRTRTGFIMYNLLMLLMHLCCFVALRLNPVERCSFWGFWWGGVCASCCRLCLRAPPTPSARCHMGTIEAV